ncbi:BTB/POZ and TAZ domain-containing protein 4 [Striga asiatica]|uniref:BTB/POZ and TAZ domain-containing protein 4 n=1 Tax=Striga asiatica TaxID=4170 RepID=A0A5A7R8H0_STRAF|nr:BTB/POZ and TAZ domain-containing protein 4 [Striga asiatica]
MDCRNDKFLSTLAKALPHPPPLPSHLTTSFHQKSFKINGSEIKEHCLCDSKSANSSWDRLFDEAYRADVSISTDGGGVIYAHASVLGVVSPVLKSMLNKSKGKGRNRLKSISIGGVPTEAVRGFIRFLYSSSYEEESMRTFALPLLVLAHAYMVPQLKRVCECWLEHKLLTTENAVDIFQLALLCDAPRLSFVCHRFIVTNFKAVSATNAWRDMKSSHPILDREIRASIIDEDVMKKERMRKREERKMYVQLYEAMEALVHICKDGCRTIGPHDKSPRKSQGPCSYAACKGLERLIRHFAECTMRRQGGCVHCKRMWQILDLHSRLCVDSDACRVPLCRKFRQRRRQQSKKEDITWRILVKKIVRSRSITGAPFFTLESA